MDEADPQGDADITKINLAKRAYLESDYVRVLELLQDCELDENSPDFKIMQFYKDRMEKILGVHQ